MFIGQIPSKEDYEQFVSKLKKAGQEKTKEIEAAASKVMQEVEKAKKDGKGTADAYLKGLKEGELLGPLPSATCRADYQLLLPMSTP
jgi:flagellar biosynthesis/type III secretory pathway protein FliH